MPNLLVTAGFRWIKASFGAQIIARRIKIGLIDKVEQYINKIGIIIAKVDYYMHYIKQSGMIKPYNKKIFSEIEDKR